ncbi:MAG: hypothetical protein WA151_22710 [Desulfatirhabdiaceae bacterium]
MEMKQIVQNLKTGETHLEDMPVISVNPKESHGGTAAMQFSGG